ncbi:sensor histidine kinase [Sphingomonas sp. M1-B02]|uniref:sensor histidine kinase n=1 Tax=Sphingomonas sp. M1-B02 TaxID=3114300 RepID=UPI002240A474|nr:sensor histidine kinase KdpD [Sphingomonas sp. S6-11]UZK67000.1 sensor histidine kinase KdpD [Sphingomonas sp. S6-11]
MNDAPHSDGRPDPEALLRTAAQEGRGRLKVLLGAAPGVGKTYEMLTEGAARRRGGTDVVIGVVETHGRAETEALVHGFEIVPRRTIEHQGRPLEEMDLDAILARRPQLVLVDELAHSNAPGSRHDKRYQDVEELLGAGIDVYSTVNIQHLESLNDVVASFTKVRVRETLPDRVLENAEIEVVDIPPDELIERLKDGKVYVPHEATRALGHFFSKSNLSALRELALRRAAQAVDTQMLEYLRVHALAGTWAGGDRLVVAVSELPGAAELVRAAKRIADALRAPWTAVHIETPRSSRFGDVENRRLAATMHLASQLGGQVASVPAATVLGGLTRFVTEARATQLIVGKSARSRWFEFVHGSVVDRLVRETPGVAVHVLPMADAGHSPARNSARTNGHGSGQPGGYLVSLGLTALVTLIGVSIFAPGSITNIGLLYLLPVMVAATRYGVRTGIFAGLASSLAYNFFFIPPTGTFTIQDPRNVLTVLVLLGVAIVTSQLVARVRGQAMLAQRSAAQNSALAGFARLLTAVRDRQALGQILCAEVGRRLDASAVLLLPIEGELVLSAAHPPEDRLEAIEQAAARWAFDHNTPAGRGSDTLTASEWLFQPIVAGGRVLGVMGLARPDASAIRSDQLPLLLSLLDQAALALERIALEGEMATITQLKERDRLRAALLSSVSHDLRTPLTTILGMLAEMRPASDEQVEQLAAARGEAERLHRFVANLLDMVRIEAGALHQSVEPIDLAEAVAAAVHDLRRALEGHPILLDVSPELPFVMVDPQLFHHCLINLLENAAKYGDSGSAITVSARRQPGAMTLSVLDEGPGLPPGDEARIFETFARIEGSDRKGGTGLGLAIVKGFAEAMGLSVSASNRDDKPGACFTIRIPEGQLKKGSASQ